jgi:hypothetical protein
MISDQGNSIDRPEFAFPAIVCSSFAIELFLKFFLMLELEDGTSASPKKQTGHRIFELWKKLTSKNRQLIAGMFRSHTGQPPVRPSEHQTALFEAALKNVGDAPFVKWRYVHEINDITFMSHASISEVVDALHIAASYTMATRSQLQPECPAVSISENNITHPDKSPEQSVGTRQGLTILEGVEPILRGQDSVLRGVPAKKFPKDFHLFFSTHGASSTRFADFALYTGGSRELLLENQHLESRHYMTSRGHLSSFEN